MAMTPLDEKADRINLYRTGPASLFAVDKHRAYEIDTAAVQVNASGTPLPAGATYLGCFGPSYGMFVFMEPLRCPEQPIAASR